MTRALVEGIDLKAVVNGLRLDRIKYENEWAKAKARYEVQLKAEERGLRDLRRRRKAIIDEIKDLRPDGKG